MIYPPLALILNEKPKFVIRFPIPIILYLYHRVETQDSKRLLLGLFPRNIHHTSPLLPMNIWTRPMMHQISILKYRIFLIKFYQYRFDKYVSNGPTELEC
jgi:hypothetical protein